MTATATPSKQRTRTVITTDGREFEVNKPPLKPGRIVLHLFLTTLGILWLVPLGISVYSSFRPFAETSRKGFLSAPESFSLDNYRTALEFGDFWDKYWNTAIILFPSLILTILLASMVAFVCSRFSWKSNIFFLVLFTSGNLLPQQIMVAPLFQAYKRIPLGAVNSWKFMVPVALVLVGVIALRMRLTESPVVSRTNMLLGGLAVLALLSTLLPAIESSNSGKLNGSNWGIILLHVGFQMGFCTFVLSNYMKLLPKELNEAAMVDGASLWTQYRHIIMPLTRPALAALATLEFAWIYNDYFWAVIFEQRGDDRPITSALSNFNGEFVTDTNAVSAAAIFVIIPVMVVYFALQKHFIAGLTLGANKG